MPGPTRNAQGQYGRGMGGTAQRGRFVHAHPQVFYVQRLRPGVHITALLGLIIGRAAMEAPLAVDMSMPTVIQLADIM